MTNYLSQEHTYASGTGLVLWVHTFHAIKMHLGGDRFAFRSICVFKTGRKIIEFWGCSLLHLNKEGKVPHYISIWPLVTSQNKERDLHCHRRPTSAAGRGRTGKNGMTMAS